MNTSIIPQLVKKDFLIIRKTVLICCLISITSIGVLSLLYGNIPDFVFANIGFTALIAPTVVCGFILLMKTNVDEKEKSTQIFIMTLPITVKEFTLAKLLVNLPIFSAIWIVITAVAAYFCFGLGLFPLGTVPFITMIFLGIFVAYTCILSVSLLSQSLQITILAIMFFEIGTSAYLWVIAYFDPISNYIYGPSAVWNTAATTIVTIQILIAVFAITVTVFIQNRKRDFI
jgi:hypothetical protein